MKKNKKLQKEVLSTLRRAFGKKQDTTVQQKKPEDVSPVASEKSEEQYIGNFFKEVISSDKLEDAGAILKSITLWFEKNKIEVDRDKIFEDIIAAYKTPSDAPGDNNNTPIEQPENPLSREITYESLRKKPIRHPSLVSWRAR